MLQPKYMKMFLEEAEQIASKYALKGTEGLQHTVNTEKGVYSQQVSNLWPEQKSIPNRVSTFNVSGVSKPVKDKEIISEPIIEEVAPSVVTTEKPQIVKESLPEVPDNVSVGDVVTASNIKNAEKVSGSVGVLTAPDGILDTASKLGEVKTAKSIGSAIKKSLIGLGLTSAIAGGIFGGLHMQSGKIATELASPEASLATKSLVDNNGIQNIIKMDKDTLLKQSPEDFYKQISSDPNFSTSNEIILNTPTLLTTKEGRVFSQELAEVSGKQVTSFKGKYISDEGNGLTSYETNNMNNENTRSIGDSFFPSNYKNKADIQLDKTSDTPWLDYSKSQVGVKEKGMSNILENGIPEGLNLGPEVEKYQSTLGIRGHAWCSSFTNWALEKAGLDSFKSGAIASNWKNYGVKLDRPAIGAFYSYGHKEGGGHVGQIVGVDAKNPKNVITIDGNAGDRVAYMSTNWEEFTKENKITISYPKGYTPNYNLPKYDLTGIENTDLFVTDIDKRLVK